MPRGRNSRGRARSSRAALLEAAPSARPLLHGKDHGAHIRVGAKDVGAAGDRWVDPFLTANAAGFRRLELMPEVRTTPELAVWLKPSARIGAIPLLGPATRKVVAGLLVEPRFRWASLGAVAGAIGFSVEPALGGAPLVPGSAREVPSWLLAGPVVRRLAALLRHRRRGFVERTETRTSPRGRIDWTTWAGAHVPSGAWATFPCTFSEPADDPELMASVRWTLARLEADLETVAWSPPARHLLRATSELRAQVGAGEARRPQAGWAPAGASEWVTLAVQAMGWVAEERGLGGARTLDGLAWDLPIDEVWEAWIAGFGAELGRRLGLVASPYGAARRPLRWRGPVQSMGALAPDVELRGRDRVVWIDAKYKAHLDLLARKGWSGLSEAVRDAHRADLHQALAYASLADVPQVDSLLVYPRLTQDMQRPATLATVTSGRRRVRLILASLPFGHRSPDEQEASLQDYRELLAA